jgi:hypothetical protein
MKNGKNILLVVMIALAVNFAVGMKFGMATTMTSDAEHYLDIAKSLAAGQGYFLTHGFWPDVPTISRSPAWPFTVSLALRLFPSVSPDLVMRCLALLLNSLVAVLVALLARRLLGGYEREEASREAAKSRRGGDINSAQGGNQYSSFAPSRLRVRYLPLLAGCVYAVYPTPLYLACNGASEMLFLALTLAGTLMLLGGKDFSREAVKAQRGGDVLSATGGKQNSPFASSRLRVRPVFLPAFGFLLLGLACLVRPNFILWIGFAILLAGFYWLKGGNQRRMGLTRSREGANEEKNKALCSEEQNTTGVSYPLDNGFFSYRVFASSREAILLVFIFLLPSTFWAARNDTITGHFPVFSTLRGQTFYGGNNDIVSGTHEFWGYWVFPDQIPGEPEMEELAKTKSEYEVDCYYYDKGKDWVRTHVGQIPGLMVGKLVRAYVPVPWKPTKATVAVSVLRWVLYLAALLGVIIFWRALDLRFRIILGAMILTNAATVVIFWGCARFAFAVEPFLIPLACAGGAVIGYKLLVICKVITPTAEWHLLKPKSGDPPLTPPWRGTS